MLSKLNIEARKYRKQEKQKYIKKATHLKKIRLDEEERKLQDCPAEISYYKDCVIFDKEKFDHMSKEKVEIAKIDDVELDNDEIECSNYLQNSPLEKD